MLLEAASKCLHRINNHETNHGTVHPLLTLVEKWFELLAIRHQGLRPGSSAPRRKRTQPKSEEASIVLSGVFHWCNGLQPHDQAILTVNKVL